MSKTNLYVSICGAIVILCVAWYTIGGKLRGEDSQLINMPSVGNNNDIQVIEAGHDGRNLVPNQITLEEGKNYEIKVTPQSNGIGCMFAATVPTLGSEVWNIKAGETFTIKVANAKVGTYPVICTSMGMKQGEIIVKASGT